MNRGQESTDFGVRAIALLARQRALETLWIEDQGVRLWSELGGKIEEARQRCLEAGVLPGEVVVTPGVASLDSLAWLFGAAAVSAVVAPLRPERIGEIENWKQWFRIDWQVKDGGIERAGGGIVLPEAMRLFEELRARNHPGLILATGGTTGISKLVLHDLAVLLAGIPVRDGQSRRTLPLMHFDHIGGLDMVWRAMAGGQVLVAPPPSFTVEGVAAAIERHHVEVLPATPSFLNLLLLSDAGQRSNLSSLRLVPYGAEAMPAGLLVRLRAALPGVEFVQRFGTSETGALPVRSAGDGLALRENQPGYEWKIIDRELWVKSPTRALGYLTGNEGGFVESGWFRTGDLAEQQLDGAVVVLGRREDLINVGGEKVLPGEVEGVLLTHPHVVDCRVCPEPNSVLGQVVGAEIVWRGPDRDVLRVKRELHEFAGSLIARHKLPVVVRLVEAIASTRNLKRARGSNS
jgi:acyl-CoA synthetase (AMP-forming)/AMP-acid ligase II